MIVTKEEKSDMDAFKELVKRAPDMELMKIDELHSLVFWSGTAMKWAKTQIGIAKELGGLNEQIDAWAEEGNAAAELNFKARAKRGELAKKTPAVKEWPGKGDQLRGAKRADKPKWQRLGYKSEKAMKDDEFLYKNPDVVEEVKKQAKEAGDFPSVTAARNEYRARKAEERMERAKEMAEQNTKEEEEKIAKQIPKVVSDHYDAIKVFKEQLELSRIGAKDGKFDPAGKNFMVKKHEAIRELLKQIEELV